MGLSLSYSHSHSHSWLHLPFYLLPVVCSSLHLPRLQFYWKYFGVEPINGRWKINLTKQQNPFDTQYTQMSIGPIIVRDVQWTRHLCRRFVSLSHLAFFGCARIERLMHIIQRKRMFLRNPILPTLFSLARSTWRKTNDDDEDNVWCTPLSMIVCNRFHSCYRLFAVALCCYGI